MSTTRMKLQNHGVMGEGTGWFFLTGPPLNLLSTGSHANWPGISLSVSGHKGILYLKILGGPVKKTTLYERLTVLLAHFGFTRAFLFYWRLLLYWSLAFFCVLMFHVALLSYWSLSALLKTFRFTESLPFYKSFADLLEPFCFTGAPMFYWSLAV